MKEFHLLVTLKVTSDLTVRAESLEEAKRQAAQSVAYEVENILGLEVVETQAEENAAREDE